MDAVCLVLAESTRPAASFHVAASLVENWYLVLAIAGSALFWIGLHYWGRYRDQFVWPGQRLQPLFLELCEVHQLSRPQRALLLKAAETNELRHAATVFVDPRILGRLAATAGPERTMHQELMTRLFGDEGNM